MRRLLLLLAFLLPALLMVGPAAAISFDEVVFTGDCMAWTTELVVHLLVDMAAVDLAYEVALVDGDGNVILATTGEAVVTDDDGDRYGTLLLSGTWDELTEETIELFGLYTIRGTFTLLVPRLDQIFTLVHEEAVTLECAVVPNDDVAWGDFKSHYR